MAYRRPQAGLIHHSDSGSQYLSDEYQAMLQRHGIRCSMSERGSCYDNAAVESFFSLLKRERIYRRHYVTREAARSDIFDYIERFYNRQRQHGHIGDISPVEFEKRTSRTLRNCPLKRSRTTTRSGHSLSQMLRSEIGT